MLFGMQAFVLKFLLFLPDELSKATTNMPATSGSRISPRSEGVAPDYLSASLTEDRKSR